MIDIKEAAKGYVRSSSQQVRPDYFSISRLNKLSSNNNKNNLFTLSVHLHTRSLPKNHNKIEEFLSKSNFLLEILSISETKLSSQSTATSNVNIAQDNMIFFTMIRP